MTLFKLSIQNIKKSFKDYAIYFFTLILGVAIFYVFNALDSQTVMMNVSSNTKEIIKLMTNILAGVSVFVSFILGFLIIYASSFLIKRRKKEFGIYLTLGMSKRKANGKKVNAKSLIGILSLGIGLILGIFLSQFMSVLVANMFEADLTKFTFVFSSTACIKTMLYFGIMYVLVMIFNTINISKCKLIDLLHANKKTEKMKLKNPMLCMFLFFLSSFILGYAYYKVTGGLEQMQEVTEIFVPILLGVLSTFFLFWSLAGLLLKMAKKKKKTYYKGLNSFILKQVSSKINTTVFSMTVICLMLFITICVLSSALSIKNSMTSHLKTFSPIDVEITKPLDLTEKRVNDSWQYKEEMIEDSKISIRESLHKMDFDVDTYFTDIVSFHTYQIDSILLKDTIGTYYEEAKEKYPYLRYESKEEFIKVSDYNQVARLLGLEEISLKENEYVIVANYDGWIPIRNEGLKKGTPVTLLNRTYYPKNTECIDGFIEISNNAINMGLFVVPDDAVNETIRAKEYLLGNYKKQTEEGKKKIEALFLNIEKHPYAKEASIEVTTKIYLYEASVGLGAMVTFIGLYLGIIFLMSSAAILALKELSESSDNKERYSMLRKIGADEKLIEKALFRQIAIFFLFPLLLAMIHSIFGILFCNSILETFGNEKLLESILMTAFFLILLYGGYFILTYLCSKNIIREK